MVYFWKVEANKKIIIKKKVKKKKLGKRKSEVKKKKKEEKKKNGRGWGFSREGRCLKQKRYPHNQKMNIKGEKKLR
jgi:hypothetical protein